MTPFVLTRGRYKSAAESLRRKQDKEREAAGLPPVARTAVVAELQPKLEIFLLGVQHPILVSVPVGITPIEAEA